MKLAETVTFGGSGLDRAAHLRDDSAALEAARCNPMRERYYFGVANRF